MTVNFARRSLALGALTAAALPGAALALSKREANRTHPYASHQEQCLTTSRVSWPPGRVGSPSTLADLKAAAAFLSDAPTGKEPYEVAQWMASAQVKGSTGEYFSTAWSNTSNPVIPWLFRFTDEAPCNDIQLDWCAAFVSWALAQSGLARLPYADVAGDAAALKCHAHASVDDFKAGDIVLLKRSGGGHIAFFAGWGREKGKFIRLLGGNQSGGRVTLNEYELAGATEALLGRKLRLDFGVPASTFKPVSYSPCKPTVVEDCDHLVAVDCNPGTWPKCS